MADWHHEDRAHPWPILNRSSKRMANSPFTCHQNCRSVSHSRPKRAHLRNGHDKTGQLCVLRDGNGLLVRRLQKVPGSVGLVG